MTIQFLDGEGLLLRQLNPEDGVRIHVPRINERVEIKDRIWNVYQVTSVFNSTFTTVPTVVVHLKKAY